MILLDPCPTCPCTNTLVRDHTKHQGISSSQSGTNNVTQLPTNILSMALLSPYAESHSASLALLLPGECATIVGRQQNGSELFSGDLNYLDLSHLPESPVGCRNCVTSSGRNPWGSGSCGWHSRTCHRSLNWRSTQFCFFLNWSATCFELVFSFLFACFILFFNDKYIHFPQKRLRKS